MGEQSLQQGEHIGVGGVDLVYHQQAAVETDGTQVGVARLHGRE
jgi:hypothetical protein